MLLVILTFLKLNSFQSNDLEILSTIHRYYSFSRYFFLERLSRQAPVLLKPKSVEIVKSLNGNIIDGYSLKGRRHS